MATEEWGLSWDEEPGEENTGARTGKYKET